MLVLRDSWLLETLLMCLSVSYVADYSDYEDSSLDFLERCSSPLTRSSGSSLAARSTFTEKTTAYQYPRAILSVDLSGESMCDCVVVKIRPEIPQYETENKYTSWAAVQGSLTIDSNYIN